jgi:class 3 adenylate cyclase/pimeloyl-ACP methyl ester carboxylesterase
MRRLQFPQKATHAVQRRPEEAVRPDPGRWLTALLARNQRTRETVPVQPETHYARSGDVSIAYQVVSEGPFDLVFVPGSVSHVELGWNVPAWAEFYRRLASFSRLIIFDKRGTGMSDRVAGVPTIETRMDDVRAVMDAVGSDRAAILGLSEGGPMSVAFAATYPERLWALVLCGALIRSLWAPDFPWGYTEEDWDRICEEERRRWGEPQFMRELAQAIAPNLDEENLQGLVTLFRQSASPATWDALNRMNKDIDVRSVLPTIRIPTLVVNRSEESEGLREGSRYAAHHIPGARHAELPGADHAPFAGDSEAYASTIEQFLLENWQERAWEEAEPDRVLATVLFTDIVGSSEQAASLGDRAWRETLERHHEVIRRQLVRFRGKEVDTAGDGFFASFDGPARAIRCGCAISEAMPELGLQVRIGLHTGECELIDGKVAGIAVHTGARVAANAQPGEVLVSSTVKDLVAGSGLTFEDRGHHELKGIPGEWRLYAVEQ